MIGESSCTLLTSAEGEVTFSVDSSAITSLAMLPVSLNVINAGRAVKSLSSDTAGSLFVMPKLTSVSPLSGSWAGGSILMVAGYGLNPADGFVTINFGESPYQKGCKIISKTSTEISCLVPDYRDSRVSQTKTVPIEIYLSGEMIKPDQDDAIILEYTFDDSLTPSSSAVSPSEYQGSVSVSIVGSGFGSDVSSVDVFLKPKTTSLYRIRRSTQSFKDEIFIKILEEFGDAPRQIHSFWKRIKRETKKNSVSWISAGSSRSKRSTDYLPYVASHEFGNEMEEHFHPLVPHIHTSTVKMLIL
jgi:hypothetical protein